MRNLICIYLLSFTFLSGAAIQEERSAQPFTHLVVNGSLDVIVSQGEEPSLLVEGDESVVEAIVTEFTGERLTIEREGSFFSWWDTESSHGKVYVTTPDLSYIRLRGSGDVIGEGSWNLDKLRVSLRGSGDVEMDLEADKLEIALKGSGDVALEGKVREQKVSLSGSGDYRASDLKSEKAVVVLRGSGNIELDVRESLNIQSRGSGDVTYWGEPRVTIEQRGSGRVRGR